MIMSEKQTAAVERKQRICDRYKGADTAEVEVIPAKPTEALEGKKHNSARCGLCPSFY